MQAFWSLRRLIDMHGYSLDAVYDVFEREARHLSFSQETVSKAPGNQKSPAMNFDSACDRFAGTKLYLLLL